jgi:hypothetical protein
MKKIAFLFLLSSFCIGMASADDAADTIRIAQLESQRDILRADIDQIDSEKARCERQKRNWTVATVAGGVGVAGTATGAVIQHRRNVNLRDDLAMQQQNLQAQQQALSAANEQLK